MLQAIVLPKQVNSVSAVFDAAGCQVISSDKKIIGKYTCDSWSLNPDAHYLYDPNSQTLAGVFREGIYVWKEYVDEFINLHQLRTCCYNALYQRGILIMEKNSTSRKSLGNVNYEKVLGALKKKGMEVTEKSLRKTGLVPAETNEKQDRLECMEKNKYLLSWEDSDIAALEHCKDHIDCSYTDKPLFIKNGEAAEQLIKNGEAVEPQVYKVLNLDFSSAPEKKSRGHEQFVYLISSKTPASLDQGRVEKLLTKLVDLESANDSLATSMKNVKHFNEIVSQLEREIKDNIASHQEEVNRSRQSPF